MNTLWFEDNLSVPREPESWEAAYDEKFGLEDSEDERLRKELESDDITRYLERRRDRK